MDEGADHGGLRFERVLGRGAMGEVWAATTTGGLPVAAKVVLPHIAASPRLLRLVEHELRATARLDHPHVIRVLGRGTVGPGQPVAAGSPWFALERCSGGTLADHPPDSFAAAVEVVVALLDALAHSHARGVLHRDLKPANVLLAGPGDARPGWKLADFGVAHAVGAGNTKRQIAGSPAYMAPEQRTGAVVDQGPWTDLYALGTMAIELTTGALPDEDAVDLDEPTARFAAPIGWWGWIGRLRAADPARRPRSAAEAWRALCDLAPQTVPPAPSGWRAPRRPEGRQRLGGAATFGLQTLPLAGREAERERLWDWLHAGDGSVASVTGPVGIGRTALLRWLAERAHETGAARVVVLDDAERVPDALARLLLALGDQTDAPPEERSARLAALGTTWPPEVARAVAELLRAPDDRWGAVPAVRDALAALVRGPTLLVLLHPGPGPEKLARALAARPVPHLRVAIAGLPVGTTLALGPLPAADVEDLGRAAAELDNDAASTLARRAEGHPGYALATLAGWVRSGALARGPRGMRVTEVDPSGAARPEVLGPLGEAGLEALERAAVQGLAVDEGLWEDSCDAPDGPDAEVHLSPTRLRARLEALAALLDRGDCVETDDGFRFVYPEVRDALLASAAAAGRLAGHHAAVAAHLVPRWRAAGGFWDAGRDLPPPERPPTGQGEAALRLARHLVGAGRPLDALAPLAVAANSFVTRAPENLQEVVELADGALRAAGLPDDHPAAVRHRIARVAHLLHRGHLEEAFAEARTAATLADRCGLPHTRGYAHARLVDAAAFGYRLADAQGSFAALRSLAAHLPVRWRVTNLAREGEVRSLAGDAAGAEAAWSEALTLARAAPRDPRMGGVWCEAAGWADRWAEVLEVTGWALPLALAEGESLTALFVASKQVEALRWLGRDDEVVPAATLVRTMAREAGAQRTEVLVLTQLAEWLAKRRRWAEASRFAEEGLALAAETSTPMYTVSLRITAAAAALALGDVARADRERQWAVAALVSLPATARAVVVKRLDQHPDPTAAEVLRAAIAAAEAGVDVGVPAGSLGPR